MDEAIYICWQAACTALVCSGVTLNTPLEEATSDAEHGYSRAVTARTSWPGRIPSCRAAI